MGPAGGEFSETSRHALVACEFGAVQQSRDYLAVDAEEVGDELQLRAFGASDFPVLKCRMRQREHERLICCSDVVTRQLFGIGNRCKVGGFVSGDFAVFERTSASFSR
jgi:hypothetical protein